MIRDIMRSVSALALFSGAAVMTTARVANAQPGRSPAVIVAITDTLTSRDAGAVLLRSERKPEDIIILKRATASPQLLGAALALMDRLRLESPRPAHLQVATVQGGVPSQTLPPMRLAALTTTLRRLVEQPTVRIGNLGSGQWIRLPSTSATP